MADFTKQVQVCREGIPNI